MKALVTGDRDWTDIEAVVRELEQLPSGSTIVHGGCRGADAVCAAVGEALGLRVVSYPADWKRFPRAAGPIRNQLMLDCEHRPGEPIDVCLAFHNDIDSSRGTRDMVSRAERAGIPTFLVTSWDKTLRSG